MMKLSMKSKLAYGSAAIGDAASYSVVATYLLFFLTTIVHISPAVAGTLIGLGTIWDVICSPIVGFWSDHCTSRMGRRRPFLLIGATFLAVSCCLLFKTIDAGPVFKAVYYGIMIIAFWIAFSTFFVPYLALGAEFTGDYDERTLLRSYAYGFNMLGLLIGIVLPSALIDLMRSKGISAESSWQITGSFIGISSAISIYITFALSKDKDIPIGQKTEHKEFSIRFFAGMLKEYWEVLKLRPIIYLLAASVLFLIANTLYSADRLYYYTYNLGFNGNLVTAVLLFASVIGFLFMPAVMLLTRWLDKRSLMILMLLTSAMLVTSAKFIGITSFGGMLLFTFVFGISGGAYWQLMPSMIYDICEYDELMTGNRREGTIVSLQSLAEALSEAVAMQLLGIILQVAGFNGESAIQSMAALEWVENSLMIIPSAFIILAAIMIYRYPITKSKFEEIQKELGERLNSKSDQAENL